MKQEQQESIRRQAREGPRKSMARPCQGRAGKRRARRTRSRIHRQGRCTREVRSGCCSPRTGTRRVSRAYRISPAPSARREDGGCARRTPRVLARRRVKGEGDQERVGGDRGASDVLRVISKPHRPLGSGNPRLLGRLDPGRRIVNIAVARGACQAGEGQRNLEEDPHRLAHAGFCPTGAGAALRAGPR